MMLSISHNYWQVMLAQGICMGLGCGLIFVPSIAILPTYFSTRRAIALGIAASGSSLGGIIYPIVFHKLEPRIGFGWATRVLGFIMIGTLAFSLCIMKVRVLPPQKRRLIQLAAWKEPPYALFSLACFFGFMGFYFPFYYVSTYAVESGITSPDTAFYFLAILNAASSFGRVLPNALADKIGPLNVAVPMTTVTAGLTLALIGIKSTAGLIVFCILYGFFSGSFVSIPPAAIASLSSDVRMIGTRMGMSFAFSGLGLLIGNPIAGQIVKRKGFESAIGFVGAVLALAAIFDMAARTAKVGLKIKVIA
jgi:predicted MFS family arabinose efflux permease